MLTPSSALEACLKSGEILSQIANHRQRLLIMRWAIPAAVLLPLTEYAVRKAAERVVPTVATKSTAGE
jgi:hypothetical protein